MPGRLGGITCLSCDSGNKPGFGLSFFVSVWEGLMSGVQGYPGGVFDPSLPLRLVPRSTTLPETDMETQKGA